MFDLERFTQDCRSALAADPSHQLVREVVARTVSDPCGARARRTKRAEVQKLYTERSDDPQRHLGTADDDHAA